jgi:hypothetical protein
MTTMTSAPQAEAPTLTDAEVLARATAPGGALAHIREAAEQEAVAEHEAEAARKAEAAIEADAALTDAAAAFIKARDKRWKLLKQLVGATDEFTAAGSRYKACQRLARDAGITEADPVQEYVVMAAQSTNWEIRRDLAAILQALKSGA